MPILNNLLQVIVLETDIEKKARRISKLEHILTVAMKNRHPSNPKMPTIVVDDCSAERSGLFDGSQSPASSRATVSRQESINSTGSAEESFSSSVSTNSVFASTSKDAGLGNGGVATGRGTLAAEGKGKGDRARKVDPKDMEFSEQRFVSQTCVGSQEIITFFDKTESCGLHFL